MDFLKMFLAAFGVLCTAPALSAADHTVLFPAAGTAMPETLWEAGPRSAGLGGAVAVTADGAFTTLLNPALLAELSGLQMAFEHSSGIQGLSRDILALTLPLADGLSLGAGVDYFNLGSIEQTKIGPGGNIEFTERILNLSLLNVYVSGGYRLSPSILIGAGISGHNQSLGETHYTTLGLKLGALIELLPGARLGILLRNLALPVAAGYPLPMSLNAGFFYTVWQNSAYSVQALVEAEAVPFSLNQSQTRTGLELGYGTWLKLRAGYAFPMAPGIGLWSGLTMGLGVDLGGWNLGYSFSSLGELGTTHRVGLGLDYTRWSKTITVPANLASPEVNARKKSRELRVSDGLNRRAEPKPPSIPKPGAADVEEILAKNEQAMREFLKENIRVKVVLSPGQGNFGRRAEFTIERESGARIKDWVLTLQDSADRVVYETAGTSLPARAVWEEAKASPSQGQPATVLRYRLLVTDLFGKREEIAGPLQAPTKPIAEERSQTEVSLPANLPIAPVYFDRGRSEITAEGAASIAQAAELARRYPGKKIKIIGHADPVEEGVESTFLAKARAEAVSRYLTAYHQISLLRIVVRGQGGENPVSAPGEANAANRRVELLLE